MNLFVSFFLCLSVPKRNKEISCTNTLLDKISNRLSVLTVCCYNQQKNISGRFKSLYLILYLFLFRVDAAIGYCEVCLVLLRK